MVPSVDATEGAPQQQQRKQIWHMTGVDSGAWAHYYMGPLRYIDIFATQEDHVCHFAAFKLRPLPSSFTPFLLFNLFVFTEVTGIQADEYTFMLIAHPSMRTRRMTFSFCSSRLTKTNSPGPRRQLYI